MVKKKTQKNEEFWFFKNYKFLFILPIFLFIFSLYVIFETNTSQGVPIYRDVTLKGGLSAIIEIENLMSSEDFLEKLESSSENSFVVSDLVDQGEVVGFIVDTDMLEEDFILLTESLIGVDLVFGENYSSNYISPSLGSAFFSQAVKILIFSFVLMSVVIFAYFRKLVPAGAVVLSALFDVVVTIGVLNFFKVELGVAGIGALLMIIGYSIDTDVLLTNRLIKEKEGEISERFMFAFKTGALMSLTTLIAGIGAMIFTSSDIIFEICLILVIGLIVDFISTWAQNAGILVWWTRKNDF